jgi:hypothetical protein
VVLGVRFRLRHGGVVGLGAFLFRTAEEKAFRLPLLLGMGLTLRSSRAGCSKESYELGGTARLQP